MCHDCPSGHHNPDTSGDTCTPCPKGLQRKLETEVEFLRTDFSSGRDLVVPTIFVTNLTLLE